MKQSMYQGDTYGNQYRRSSYTNLTQRTALNQDGNYEEQDKLVQKSDTDEVSISMYNSTSAPITPSPFKAWQKAEQSASSSGQSPVADKRTIQNLKNSFGVVLFGCKLNLLLPLGLIAAIGRAYGLSNKFVFVLALLGITPLAERLGFVTEQLAMSTNPTIGALLNATLGNLTELIVSWLALKQGMLRVVQLSLLGSVVSNLLLVLGMSFIAGGLYHHTQRFNCNAVIANLSLLGLGCASLAVPHLLSTDFVQQSMLNNSKSLQAGDEDVLIADTSSDVLSSSRVIAAFMIIAYAAFLYFQIVSHRGMYDESQDDDDDEPQVLQFLPALLWLCTIAVCIAFLSEYLVNTIEDAATGLALSLPFISTILLPIVGNAAEHAAAIIFASRNKIDLALGVAVGSGTQITLLALPLSVLAGGLLDQGLTLDLGSFELGCFVTCIGVVCVTCYDGTAHWLKGLTLLLAYCVMSVGFWYKTDANLDRPR